MRGNCLTTEATVAGVFTLSQIGRLFVLDTNVEVANGATPAPTPRRWSRLKPAYGQAGRDLQGKAGEQPRKAKSDSSAALPPEAGRQNDDACLRRALSPRLRLPSPHLR